MNPYDEEIECYLKEFQPKAIRELEVAPQPRNSLWSRLTTAAVVAACAGGIVWFAHRASTRMKEIANVQAPTVAGSKASVDTHSKTNLNSPRPTAGTEDITPDILANAANTRAAVEGGGTAVFAQPSRQEPSSQRNAKGELSTTGFEIAPPPHDPFEPIMSQPQVVGTLDARRAVEAQLRDAFMKRAVPAGGEPYTLKISFDVSGDTQEIGPGEMEETRNPAGVRRWTGHLGSYSITRIITAGTHDTGSPGPIPMRLYMAREYAGGAPLTPMGSMRTANGTLNGTPLNCVLSSQKQTVVPGRDWSETEYCIDSQSGLLRVYSTAPGMYVVYEYGGSSFHGRVVADQVTITVAGKIVLQGSITLKNPDLDSLDPTLFTPTSQMATNGVQLTGPPTHHVQSRGTITASGPIQPIVVHAMVSPDGSVVEAEALQTLDPELSQSAVDLVKKTKYNEVTRYSVPPQLEIYDVVQ